MPAIPSTNPAFKTISIRPQNGVKGTPSESGKFRGSDLGAETLFLITIQYRAMTSSEVETLNEFYRVNKTDDNTVTPIDGRLYDCWFAGDIAYTEVSPTRQHGTVRLWANLR